MNFKKKTVIILSRSWNMTNLGVILALFTLKTRAKIGMITRGLGDGWEKGVIAAVRANLSRGPVPLPKEIKGLLEEAIKAPSVFLSLWVHHPRKGWQRGTSFAVPLPEGATQPYTVEHKGESIGGLAMEVLDLLGRILAKIRDWKDTLARTFREVNVEDEPGLIKVALMWFLTDCVEKDLTAILRLILTLEKGGGVPEVNALGIAPADENPFGIQQKRILALKKKGRDASAEEAKLAAATENRSLWLERVKVVCRWLGEGLPDGEPDQETIECLLIKIGTFQKGGWYTDVPEEIILPSP
jgi:hypothetical protein